VLAQDFTSDHKPCAAKGFCACRSAAVGARVLSSPYLALLDLSEAMALFPPAGVSILLISSGRSTIFVETLT